MSRPAVAKAITTAASAPTNAGIWSSVRAEFDLDPTRAHLAQFLLAAHPRPVRDAIARHREQLDRNPYTYVEDNVAAFETATRAAAARYLGSEPDAIALTDSTTMGLGLVYSGFILEPGKEILTTEHDHPSTRWSLTYRAQRGDAKVRTVKLFDDSSTLTVDAFVGALKQNITPNTRLLTLTWVQSATGVKTPVADVVAMVRDLNRGRVEKDRLLIALDGVHAFGVESESAAQLGVDYFMAGCHKWLFGPRGTGLVWASPAGWAAVRPTIPTFDMMIRPMQRDQLPMAMQLTPGGFHSFEHRWALSEAFAFHERLGRERVTARIHELNRHCKEALMNTPGIILHTPLKANLSAGLVCFNVQGRTPDAVVASLRTKNILASASPYAFKCVRFSPGLVNTEAEIEQAVAGLRSLA